MTEPEYYHAGNGKFLPANDAARQECEAWNAYAEKVNARTSAQEGRSDVPANR